MAKGKTSLAASKKAVDPTLDALFTTSSGPVQAPSASRYSGLLPLKERKPVEQVAELVEPSGDEQDDESLSELSENDEDGDEQSSEEEEEDTEAVNENGNSPPEAAESDSEPEETIPKRKDRKRKRKDAHDDLEEKYLQKLADDESEEEPTDKRRKGADGEAVPTAGSGDDDEDDAPIVHESLLKQAGEEHKDIEMDKANRTLFLGNISIEAISSKRAKQQLLAHLEASLSSLDSSTGPHKVESLRFRSTPFATGAMPKRAAYITKQLMPATTRSTNAYAVFSSPATARCALQSLNGTVILDRHLRVDSVAHPTPTAHRRCVFVGNLDFMDDETVLNTQADGETTSKKRHKVPADTEEGLWRTFSTQGMKVESVRVPRDPKTRVGKGFAYVQFYDANDVESALLLDGKKFPPLLPRALRVSRAKDPRKTQLAMERNVKAKLDAAEAAGNKSAKHKPKIMPEQQSLAGRASRLLGRSGAARQRSEMKKFGGGGSIRDNSKKLAAAAAAAAGSAGPGAGAIRTPEQIVFEGRRASSKDGRPKDLKMGKKGGGKKKGPPKTRNRGARRAAEWRSGKSA